MSGTNPLNPAQTKTGASSPSKTIVCTQENAAEFQKVVRAWPELRALVQGLQADNLFPGLRAMRITLTGSAEQRAQGLAALLPENAPEGRKTESRAPA